MKNVILTLVLATPLALFSQATLEAVNFRQDTKFKIYEISGFNAAELDKNGSSVVWDLGEVEAEEIALADMVDISRTPYAANFPTANFAMRVMTDRTSTYDILSMNFANQWETKLEVLAENMGQPNYTLYDIPRKLLVFPFPFQEVFFSSYQVENGILRTVSTAYTGYGSIHITSKDEPESDKSVTNVAKLTVNDQGNQSVMFWSVDPVYPILQIKDGKYILFAHQKSLLGLDELSNDELMIVYPNPVSSELSLKNASLVSRVEIYSLNGQLQIESTDTKVNVDALTAGSYLLKAYADDAVTVLRFVKE